MPIQSLEPYLFERKLAHVSSFEILSNAVLGIDTEYYLSRIYTYRKEQSLAAIGGVPSSLKDYIQLDLQVFQEFNIKPVFVIPGLPIQSQVVKYRSNELSPQEQHHDFTWKKIYSNAHTQHPYENFRLHSETLPLEPLVNDLIKIFIELGTDYLVTPYNASFQLSYLYQKGLVDALYGSTDLLLTKIDKFIISMEFSAKEFRYVDKFKMLHDLGLNDRQFQDLSLMVGCAVQPKTFPIFPPQPKPTPNYPPINNFKIGLDILYQYMQFSGDISSLYGYVLNLNDPKLTDLYTRGQTAIKYAPIINKEGYTELYNVEMGKFNLEKDIDFIIEDDLATTTSTSSVGASPGGGNSKPTSTGTPSGNTISKIPVNLHEIISQRLPPEFYFYQSIGLLPIKLLNSVTNGQYDVRPPLELGNNDTFKKLITSKFYLDNLDQQYNLLTQLMARYYQVKKIKVKFWFGKEVELNSRMTPTVSKRIGHLFVAKQSETFDLRTFFADALSGEHNAKADLRLPGDIVSTVVLRTMFLFGIVDEKDQVTSIGKILEKLARETPHIKQDELESLVLILLLLKSNTLKLNQTDKEFPSVANHYKVANSTYELNASEAATIGLISKITSLKKFHSSPINYQGPVSRSLLNFRSHVEFINSTLLHTSECVLTDLIVKQQQNDVRSTFENKTQWFQLIDQLPFFNNVNNTLMGIVAEIYFEVALKNHKTTGTSTADAAAFATGFLTDHIFQVSNPTHNANVYGVNSTSAEQIKSALKDAVSWWKLFVTFSKIVNDVDKSLCDDSLLKAITEAESLVATFS
ncbi:hypothetical protein KGF57_000208 [Candida theae]|uniref:XPG-I domain-containing protein n=1 Tax=Candida theae TaxID=1198502 RepID=A0AAD5BJB3_9ASCO|nr:uncharacterized protein KGF57_000208 [Candida theae]KAI5968349.1 hypothetical protein KGF57_000208 [Candida theae]